MQPNVCFSDLQPPDLSKNNADSADLAEYITLTPCGRECYCVQNEILSNYSVLIASSNVDFGDQVYALYTDVFLSSDFTLLQPGEGSSSSSQTDTLSITSLSSPRSDTSDAGCQLVQHDMDSTHARSVSVIIYILDSLLVG